MSYRQSMDKKTMLPYTAASPGYPNLTVDQITNACIVIDTTAGVVNPVLPAVVAAQDGLVVEFKLTKPGGNNATISAAGPLNIDGAANMLMNVDNSSRVLMYYHTSVPPEWQIVASYL